MNDWPDLNVCSALENDGGILKLYRWLNGDDAASPDVYDNLPRTAQNARDVAKRALEYAAKCDALLATERQSDP